MVPKFKNLQMVEIEQGGKAKAAHDVVNGTIDGITKTTYFSYCRLVSGANIAKRK